MVKWAATNGRAEISFWGMVSTKQLGVASLFCELHGCGFYQFARWVSAETCGLLSTASCLSRQTDTTIPGLPRYIWLDLPRLGRSTQVDTIEHLLSMRWASVGTWDFMLMGEPEACNHGDVSFRFPPPYQSQNPCIHSSCLSPKSRSHSWLGGSIYWLFRNQNVDQLIHDTRKKGEGDLMREPRGLSIRTHCSDTPTALKKGGQDRWTVDVNPGKRGIVINPWKIKQDLRDGPTNIFGCFARMSLMLHVRYRCLVCGCPATLPSSLDEIHLSIIILCHQIGHQRRGRECFYQTMADDTLQFWLRSMEWRHRNSFTKLRSSYRALLYEHFNRHLNALGWWVEIFGLRLVILPHGLVWKRRRGRRCSSCRQKDVNICSVHWHGCMAGNRPDWLNI